MMVMVIKMNREDLWNLFKMTGKIEYYLKYKTCKEGSFHHDKKSNRNSD